jgi:enamine deaminase RidA (YjgF/YER057c/UK114 family)
MSPYRIINPASLGAPSGWNNGLLAPAGGRVLFVAGQTARDATGKVPPLGFVEQFGRALENVLAVVKESGGGPEHVGRLTIYVTDLGAYRTSLKPLGDAYRRLMGRHYPAMALVQVAGLVDPNALVEIEATAVVG